MSLKSTERSSNPNVFKTYIFRCGFFTFDNHEYHKHQLYLSTKNKPYFVLYQQ